MKHFTRVRNILQQYEIFYNSTKYFTAVRNILQEYEIFYSNTKYFTAIRNILQQYEILLDISTMETNCCISLASLETFVLLKAIFISTITQRMVLLCFHGNNGEAKALNIT